MKTTTKVKEDKVKVVKVVAKANEQDIIAYKQLCLQEDEIKAKKDELKKKIIPFIANHPQRLYDKKSTNPYLMVEDYKAQVQFRETRKVTDLDGLRNAMGTMWDRVRKEALDWDAWDVASKRGEIKNVDKLIKEYLEFITLEVLVVK